MIGDVVGNFDADNVRPDQKLIPSKMTSIAANHDVQQWIG
jgi:hypothetical protein